MAGNSHSAHGLAAFPRFVQVSWSHAPHHASPVMLAGWYGLRKGYRGRFGMYVPPVLEHLGLAEVEHQPRNNRMRAV